MKTALRTQPTSAPPPSFTPVRTGLLQRKCACGGSPGPTGECESCGTKRLQRQDRNVAARSLFDDRLSVASTVQSIVEEGLISPGQPLDGQTRAFMEPRLGHDFGRVGITSESAHSNLIVQRANDPLELAADEMAERALRTPLASSPSGSPLVKPDLSRVRIHQDIRAANSAHALNARAYTLGQDIVFGANEFAPETMAGKRLLAHELAHVLQQNSPTVVQRQPKPDKSSAQKKPDEKQPPKHELRKDSQAEARASYKRLKTLGVAVEEPVEVKKHWIVRYRKLSKQQAQAEAATKQKDLGDERKAGVDYDDESASYYVKILLNCPAGVPAKTGFHIWPKCFPTKERGEVTRQKLVLGYGTAEFFNRADAVGFGLYYKTITTTDLADQQASANKQLDAEKGQPPLKKCPDGYKDMGQFLVTAYHLPQEAEFAAKPIKQNPSGLTGDFRDDFLDRVVVEGSGVALSGDIIRYVGCKEKKRGNKCADPIYRISPCAETASGTCAAAGRTVAVDPKVIPLKSELFIEGVGIRIAEDTGGGIKGNDIDVYRGLISAVQAKKLTLPGKPKVCMKSKGDNKPANKPKDE